MPGRGGVPGECEWRFSALDNVCPHRQGPLGQGWIEGDVVVCPWHSWAFDVKTGLATYPENERVGVFPLRIEGENVLINIESRREGESSSERHMD